MRPHSSTRSRVGPLDLDVLGDTKLSFARVARADFGDGPQQHVDADRQARLVEIECRGVMFGGKLGDLDAHVPLPSESSQLGGGASGLAWMENDYRGALNRARSEGKLVFVNFTGRACTNCHWMKRNMFTRPESAAAMKQYVLLELYTDTGEASSEENQKLQDSKFKTIAIPFYAIIDPDE